MFTGLIEATGTFWQMEWLSNAGRLYIQTNHEMNQLNMGESIAVNGVCLTLEEYGRNGNNLFLVFHVMRETFQHTNLKNLPKMPLVNLERALTVGSRIGGHFLTGHVDTVAEVIDMKRQNDDIHLNISLPRSLKPYLVYKGAIGVNGVSLTVMELDEFHFSVCLIPTTLRDTNLSKLSKGTFVNLEADIFGKYVISYMENIASNRNETTSDISMEQLKRAGF